MTALILAATLNFLAALLHLAVILGGPAWYRFFGAGEHMAQLAERGNPWPALLTLMIAAVLAGWGCYCLALAGLLPPLPWMLPIVQLITAIYLIRALYPLLLAPVVPLFRTPFMIWSSLICAGFGLSHLLGVLPLSHWS
ncbi:hypothetical protein [Marinobacterium arenosum]|uniref:hypothetical protein n=1 Tax=Marinobacterium arenosum TaxID=2862496 RepID=UPI001C957435|nr:hypothetical protein [Marinobacterium arenosum]MBY4675795.1 hypothetical protein [Marinobacterium arenosum]